MGLEKIKQLDFYLHSEELIFLSYLIRHEPRHRPSRCLDKNESESTKRRNKVNFCLFHIVKVIFVSFFSEN